MNKVEIEGILFDLNEKYTVGEQVFYKGFICSKRTSGYEDIIKVTISAKLLPIENKETICYIKALGEFRSYNVTDETGKNKLELYLHIRKLEDYEKFSNKIYLEGAICKPPSCRVTPFNKVICNFFIASNRRSFNKSDYIPCIAWNENAEKIKDLPVGTRLQLEGRVQSREYTKNEQIKVAYEVSISKIVEVKNEIK